MVAAKFKNKKAIRRVILEICRGHSKEVIAASIQAVTEDLMLRSVRAWSKEAAVVTSGCPAACSPMCGSTSC